MTRTPKGLAQRDVEITLGWPVLPNGITWSVTVPASQVQEATKRMVELWQEIDEWFAGVPVPGPDTIPSGGSQDVPDNDDYWDRMKAKPGKGGF